MRSRYSLFAFKGLVPALSSHVPNFQVELVGAKLTHTGRYHIHLLAARLHSNKVESRPAHTEG
jgi:hypothetical protein